MNNTIFEHFLNLFFDHALLEIGVAVWPNVYGGGVGEEMDLVVGGSGWWELGWEVEDVTVFVEEGVDGRDGMGRFGFGLGWVGFRVG